MKGLLTIEFIICLLVTLSINAVFIASEKSVIINFNKTADKIESIDSIEVEDYCNLIYFNWKNLEIDFATNIKISDIGKIKCLTPSIEQSQNKLAVEGSRKWF